MKRLTHILIVLMTLCPSLWAMDKVNAWLDKETITLGEYAILTISIEGASGEESIEVPEIDGCRILNGGQSSSFHSVNGVGSHKVTRRFIFSPEKVGIYTIPPCRISDSKRTLQTKPFSLKVSLKPKKKTHSSESKAQRQSPLKVTMEVDKAEVYVDEPITLRIKVYLDERAAFVGDSIRFKEAPEFIDFIEDRDDQNYRFEGTLNGRPCLIIESRRILYPTKEGEFTFQKVSVLAQQKVRIQNQKRRRRDPFGEDFFGGRSSFPSIFDSIFDQNYKILDLEEESEEVKLKVLALPQEGKPKAFKGDVGNYKINLSYPGLEELRVGDALTVMAEVTGIGHIKSISEPVWLVGEEFKVFKDTDVETNTKSQAETMVGSKVFKKVMIPQKAGQLKLPGASFSFFNPTLKRYQVIEKKGPTFSVKENLSQGNQKIYDFQRDNLKDLNPLKPQFEEEDLFYIELNKELLMASNEPLKWSYFWGFQLLLLLMTGLFSFFINYRKHLSANVHIYNKRKALKIFHQEIKKIQKRPEEESMEKLKAFDRVWKEYFGKKLNQSSGAITANLVDDILIPKGLSKEVGHRIKEVFSFLEAAVFGLASPSSEELNELFAKSMSILEEVESWQGW